MVWLSIPSDADIFICAGDACEGFNPADLQDFFTWYAAIPARLRIFVPCNHDRIFNTLSTNKNLYLAIAGARPKYHIFGHVHEEGLQRKAMLGGATFLNVSYFEALRQLCL